MQIIIIYDANDRRACDFFDEMKDHLLPSKIDHSITLFLWLFFLDEAEGSSTPNGTDNHDMN